MIETTHVLNQIPDYVLDLLPIRERIQVEKHVTGCTKCRWALQQETQLGKSVHTTLHIATQPTYGRLQSLMPPTPARPMNFWGLIWQKQLAPLGLIILLVFGAMGIWGSSQHTIWAKPSPTSLAATATMTDVPTAALTETEAVSEGIPFHTAVAIAPTQPDILITPAPNPTPVAVGPQMVISN